MILPSSDGSFSCVASVGGGRSELEIDILGVEKFFEDVAGFVVEALDDRLTSGVGEALVELGVCA